MLISKNFRFSGRHIGFLEGSKYGLKAPSCSQIIFKKSREGASLHFKWFGNGSKKSGLGGNLPPRYEGYHELALNYESCELVCGDGTKSKRFVTESNRLRLGC